LLKLVDLGQPSEFWEYFEHITKIPRCSKHEEQIRTYIKGEAERLGFETEVDGAGNLVVRILAHEKEKQKVVLQCHLDMVCEKNEEVVHDFSKDPLELKIVNIGDEKWVTAEGTTLGADNGVGICYLLTLMQKIQNNEINFGSLGFDLLFTVDEEMGLNGAFKIDKDLIDGNFLINLDAEDEDAVIIGCAGGRVSLIHIKKDHNEVKKRKMEALNKKDVVNAVEKHGKILAVSGRYEKPRKIVEHMYASMKKVVREKEFMKENLSQYDVVLIGCPGSDLPNASHPKIRGRSYIIILLNLGSWLNI